MKIPVWVLIVCLVFSGITTYITWKVSMSTVPASVFILSVDVQSDGSAIIEYTTDCVYHKAHVSQKAFKPFLDYLARFQ
jgi:hypothetical protein